MTKSSVLAGHLGTCLVSMIQVIGTVDNKSNASAVIPGRVRPFFRGAKFFRSHGIGYARLQLSRNRGERIHLFQSSEPPDRKAKTMKITVMITAIAITVSSMVVSAEAGGLFRRMRAARAGYGSSGSGMQMGHSAKSFGYSSHASGGYGSNGSSMNGGHMGHSMHPSRVRVARPAVPSVRRARQLCPT